MDSETAFRLAMFAIIITIPLHINSWLAYRSMKDLRSQVRDLRVEVERLNRLGSDEFMTLDSLRNRIWRLENPQGVAEVTDA